MTLSLYSVCVNLHMLFPHLHAKGFDELDLSCDAHTHQKAAALSLYVHCVHAV